MTTQAEIRGWLNRAVKDGNTHVLVVVDTFDHEDYPVFLTVETQETLDREIVAHGGNMQRIMEVYAMHLPVEEQLQEHRANHPVIAPAR